MGMFSLMDNTVLDGKGVEFPQFVVDRKESDRFIARVLAPLVEKLAERQVIWDLFNEPENVTGAELRVVQDFVDRALTVLRGSDADAKFTVVASRDAPCQCNTLLGRCTVPIPAPAPGTPPPDPEPPHMRTPHRPPLSP